MKQHKEYRRLAAAFAVAAVTGLVFIGGSASAAPNGGGGAPKTSTMYDAVTVPLHGNMPSVGFEAYSLSEFGDAVTLAPGSNRTLRNVTVTLSSWGCEDGTWIGKDCRTTTGTTFPLEMTFNVYDETGATKLASATQTFAIPYRPSASTKCVDSEGAPDGRWYDSKLKTCFNGLATNVTFAFSDVTLKTDNIVYGIVYNTSHHGPNPVGDTASCYTESGGCGYDSLNILLNDAITVGAQAHLGEAWANSTWSGFYCDAGAGGTGTFRRDSVGSPCWYNSDGSPQIPAVQIKGAK